MPQTFTITVNPTPNVVQPVNQALCNGATTNAINFTGTVSGSTFSWTNNNTSIGLAASGNGNIAAFTAINLTNAPVTATITVTPWVAVGCPGAPQSFTITVNPIPNVVQPVSQSLCNGATTNLVSFTGAVAGTIFNWTNSNTTIGLAASGIGDIAAFSAINLTNVPVTATITVTPTAAGCPGTAQSFTITVNPTPNVVTPASQTLCNTATTNAISFTGSVSGSTFTWANNNTSIGLAASGNGNIPAFTAVNLTNAPVTATITVTASAGGCLGIPQSFTITVNPTPNVVQPANQTLCNGATTNLVAFSGAVAGTIFNWTNSNTTIGLAASGSGDISSFTAINLNNAPVTATITVTPTAASCPGTAQSFIITVNPTPNVVQPANQALCNGATTNAITFTGSIGSSTFSWTNNNTTIGLAASGSGNIPAFTAINVTNAPVTATITVTASAAGCQSTPQVFAITVNPTANVVQPANQTVCNGSTTNLISFSGAVAGTIFNWTNSNTTIGLAASGNGNIPAFAAINLTNAPVTATITVTPSAAGCPGAPQTFTITVNPTPTVQPSANQTLCNGATTSLIAFSGGFSGTTYSWTNNNPSIGLAASGNGNIPAFTAINLTNVPVTATLTVTPSAAGCSGAPQIFTITVNPTANVVQPANQILCNGATTNLVSFAGAVSGSIFSWTNNNTSIGLAASGIGNIPAFTAFNTGTTPVTATITITPSAAGCAGIPQKFTITVNPIPNVVRPPDQALCNGFTANAINFSSAVSGTNFNWTNNNTTIGLGASGTGNIRAFAAINLTGTPLTATITVTPSAAGCVGSARPFTIVVKPTPTVELGPNLNLSTGSLVTLNSVIQNGPIINWAWTPATGLSCNDCPAPVLRVTNNITYTVWVTNNYGCIATDNLSVSTFCKNSQVFIPNAFTPDGDGLNDVLMVRGVGIFVKSFRIFNRWGQLVFEKTDFNPNEIKNGWDGKVRGVPATPDVFVYTAEVICDNGIMYTFKGNSTLLK
jgi:gliding motility-associated-like protein